ncbi:hypothetical protein [Agromyces larvae]|uniref:Ppx/GppA family phosphatase n=1 Tax=Agromyces larvae TaxID=2929802 RepID=A0ABY4C2Z2_9MICO|nr:hypothetical protein [Agromyces larvae]UOE45846.1 hypothetical protein MTO99_08920 [Agromyces larvae]
MSTEPRSEAGADGAPRQRVERAPGRARRARLTPAPGSDPSPEQAVPGAHEPDAPRKRGNASADDERITRERPPHW